MPSSSIPPAGEIVDVILQIVLPAGIPALALPFLLTRKLGSKGLEIGLLLGAGLGLVLANFLRGTLPWAPRGWGWSWFLLAWLTAWLAGVAGVWLGHRRFFREGCALAAAGLAGWALLPESFRSFAWAFPLLAVTVWLPWIGAPASVVESGTLRRSRVPDVLLLLTLALLGGSMVLIHAHSARLMDVALIAACTLAGGVVIAGWHGSDGCVLWGIPCLTLPGLMLAGWNATSSDVPMWSFVLTGLSAWPLVAFRNRTPRMKARILRGILVLVPVSVAVVLAMRAETLEF